MSLEFSDLEANKQSSLISQITNMLQSMYQMPLPPKNSTTAPSYYGDYVIKPIDFIVNNDIPFAEGCIIKYVVRWKQKNGVEDLKKAKVYLDKLIKLDEKQSNKKDNIYDSHVAI
jgi:hypothetical protein